jgi:hypothetical protein
MGRFIRFSGWGRSRYPEKPGIFRNAGLLGGGEFFLFYGKFKKCPDPDIKEL